MRYPGGKRRLLKIITRRLQQMHRPGAEYREPFFGAGSVGLGVIESIPTLAQVWFNDGDPPMACTWWGVVRETEHLKQRLRERMPVDWFYRFFKKRLLSITTAEELANHYPSGVAFQKIFVHQTSYSGLGTRSGGPLGGRNQAGATKIDSRYNVETLCRNIDLAARLIASVEHHPDVCSCLDFEEVIRAPGDAFFYLDPPYYRAGPALYQKFFAHDDHVRLASVLREEERPWLVSYDAHPVIEDLYRGWSTIDPIDVKYSITGSVRASELLITNS